MKELDLLKKDWKKQEKDLPTLSYNEIYKIIHKKSSSIVKWILVICIAEFIFMIGINFLIPDNYLEIYDKLQLSLFLTIGNVISYIVIAIFIYLFYKNYKRISVTDSTKLLMNNIIRTRKTVNFYVYYNIIFYIIISIILNTVMFLHPGILQEFFTTKNPDIETENIMTVFFVVQIIALIIICGLLWLYYRIIYGILLKKLNFNFKELGALEK